MGKEFGNMGKFDYKRILKSSCKKEKKNEEKNKRNNTKRTEIFDFIKYIMFNEWIYWLSNR